MRQIFKSLSVVVSKSSGNTKFIEHLKMKSRHVGVNIHYLSKLA